MKIKKNTRSCIVEAPKGTFKIYYHINEMAITGIEKVQIMFDIIRKPHKLIFN